MQFAISRVAPHVATLANRRLDLARALLQSVISFRVHALQLRPTYAEIGPMIAIQKSPLEFVAQLRRFWTSMVDEGSDRTTTEQAAGQPDSGTTQ